MYILMYACKSWQEYKDVTIYSYMSVCICAYRHVYMYEKCLLRHRHKNRWGYALRHFSLLTLLPHTGLLGSETMKESRVQIRQDHQWNLALSLWGLANIISSLVKQIVIPLSHWDNQGGKCLEPFYSSLQVSMGSTQLFWRLQMYASLVWQQSLQSLHVPHTGVCTLCFRCRESGRRHLLNLCIIPGSTLMVAWKENSDLPCGWLMLQN